LEIELQALGAQEAHLKTILGSYSGYLKRLPDKELKLVRLMRDKELNDKIYTRLLEEREQARIREAAEIGNLRVTELADLPAYPARPRTVFNMGIGLMTGSILGLLLIFVAEFFRERPRTPEEMERILNFPVLASVPLLKHTTPFKLNGRQAPRALTPHRTNNSLTRDAYAYLWNSLQILDNVPGQVIMLTSAGPAEGKSTIAANLSLTAARHGKKTILIDGDLRKPVLHELFGISIAPGLTNLVAEVTQAWPYTEESQNNGEHTSNQVLPQWKNLTLREAIVSYMGNVLQVTATPNLRLLPKGNAVFDPDIVWASPMIQEILQILKQNADFIIIDTPPVIGIPDAGLIASYSDGIVFCVEAGSTDKTMLLRAQKVLARAGNRFLGVVLNKVDPNSVYGRHRYYKYYMKHYEKA
jgi:tyrosine-protein kinase Etk/Wzc